jgi:hypothetical protein
MTKQFLSGLEETIARFGSLVLTVLLFSIYIVAVEQITFDWRSGSISLAFFWFVYELIAFILFTMFKFFGEKNQSNNSTAQIEETNNPDNTVL